MSETAMTYLKETDRYGNVRWEVVLCAACLAQHLRTYPAMWRGERRVTRAWLGKSGLCGFCVADVAGDAVGPRS